MEELAKQQLLALIQNAMNTNTPKPRETTGSATSSPSQSSGSSSSSTSGVAPQDGIHPRVFRLLMDGKEAGLVVFSFSVHLYLRG